MRESAAIICGVVRRWPSHTLLARGAILTVAERARVPIIGLRYGLPLYFARYASSMRSLIGPFAGSNVTSFVMPAVVIRPAFCCTAAWYQRDFCPL